MRTRFERRGVLAGAYLFSLGHIVAHYVCMEDFKEGRIVRRRGDTLCKRVAADRMSDARDDNSVICPRCDELRKRLER